MVKIDHSQGAGPTRNHLGHWWERGYRNSSRRATGLILQLTWIIRQTAWANVDAILHDPTVNQTVGMTTVKAETIEHPHVGTLFRKKRIELTFQAQGLYSYNAMRTKADASDFGTSMDSTAICTSPSRSWSRPNRCELASTGAQHCIVLERILAGRSAIEDAQDHELHN